MGMDYDDSNHPACLCWGLGLWAWLVHKKGGDRTLPNSRSDLKASALPAFHKARAKKVGEEQVRPHGGCAHELQRECMRVTTALNDPL